MGGFGDISNFLFEFQKITEIGHKILHNFTSYTFGLASPKKVFGQTFAFDNFFNPLAPIIRHQPGSNKPREMNLL